MFDVFMYVDDTTLVCDLNDIQLENQSTVLNLELEKASKWLACNKMPLNLWFSVKKIQVIKSILHMNVSIIDRVEHFLFLGLVLSSNLKWNCHIDHISQKILRAI